MISLVRTEFTKAARRTRTLVVGALLVGLPALIVFALHQRNNVRQANAGEGLFRLARQSGLLVPAAVLGATSGFLLVVIAATFAGDSVAGDSAWGNLRYLLMRPVPRGRLLVAKATVAGLLIWVSTFLVALAGLLAGIALFGAHPVNVVAIGLQISEKTLMLRVLLSTAYVAFGFTALLALGTFFSVLTDTAAGAIGATAGVYIVSEILDGITQLGRVRYLFPTHYLDSWQSMFTDNRYSHDMIAGVLVQVGYLVVFGTLAAVYFRRKDIRS
ncbi:MAG TPA: ABC transporter permease subunit [Acidimicrobiia bacterium]|nr:ABC transporter permease subunit [Acidimicrobiia bacterium]